jgi:hypothetical protein
MWELLSKLNGGELIALTAVLGVFVAGAISAIVNQWRKVRVAELEAALKQQMLEKGMSAADIEQVLKASRKSDDSKEHSDRSASAAFTGSAASDKAALIKLMAENDWSGKDIERVLRAFGQFADGCPPGQEQTVKEKAVAVKDMVENGMSAEDIERVLLAFEKPAERVAGG